MTVQHLADRRNTHNSLQYFLPPRRATGKHNPLAIQLLQNWLQHPCFAFGMSVTWCRYPPGSIQPTIYLHSSQCMCCLELSKRFDVFSMWLRSEQMRCFQINFSCTRDGCALGAAPDERYLKGYRLSKSCLASPSLTVERISIQRCTHCIQCNVKPPMRPVHQHFQNF